MATTVQSHKPSPHPTPQAHPTPHVAPHGPSGGHAPSGGHGAAGAKGDRATVSNQDADDKGGSAAAAGNIVHNVHQHGAGKGAGAGQHGVSGVGGAHAHGAHGKGGAHAHATGAHSKGGAHAHGAHSGSHAAGGHGAAGTRSGQAGGGSRVGGDGDGDGDEGGARGSAQGGAAGGSGRAGGGGGTGLHSGQLGLSGGMGGNVQNMTNAARQTLGSAGQAQQNKAGGAGTAGKTQQSNVPGNVGQWINQAMQIMQQNGVDTSKINPRDLATIIQHESGGNPNAINRTDSNAAAGHPSQGLMQTIPSTFNSYALSGHNSITNPVDNIIAGSRYILSRYGSTANVPGIKALNSGGSYVGY